MYPAEENLYTGEVRKKSKVGILFIMKKGENVTLIGKGAYSEPLILKNRFRYIYCFIICVDSANEYLYSGEVRKKSQVEIFFIHENV